MPPSSLTRAVLIENILLTSTLGDLINTDIVLAQFSGLTQSMLANMQQQMATQQAIAAMQAQNAAAKGSRGSDRDIIRY